MSRYMAQRFASASMHLRTGDLRRATRAGRNRKTEAMQFDDRSDQAQAQAKPLGAAAFIRAIEALSHRFAFDVGDAWTSVAHLDYRLAVSAAVLDFGNPQ